MDLVPDSCPRLLSVICGPPVHHVPHSTTLKAKGPIAYVLSDLLLNSGSVGLAFRDFFEILGSYICWSSSVVIHQHIGQFLT